jgi:hypothetical protein
VHRFLGLLTYLNFTVWLLALVHGLTAGTDAGTTWALVLYAALGLARACAHRLSVRWGDTAPHTS